MWRTQPSRNYTSGQPSVAVKLAAAGLLSVGGGLGGTVLYAKWDPKFRSAVETYVPYSESVFSLALGARPAGRGQVELAQPPSMMEPQVKVSKAKSAKKVKEAAETSAAPEASPGTAAPAQSIEEASAEATHIISSISDVPSVPATCDSEAAPPPEGTPEAPVLQDPVMSVEPESPVESVQPLKERPEEEVSARLAQQEAQEEEALALLSSSLEEALSSCAKATLSAVGAQEEALQAVTEHTLRLKEAMEAEVPPEEKSAQWKHLESACVERKTSVENAAEALLKANEALSSLKASIDGSKGLKISAARPLILAAEENLHNMVVDLDQAVTKVQTAESESKIVSQYSELVKEAKLHFQREISSLTPDIQAGWKGLTGKLTVDDLNALIAHAHRRMEQLSRELAEQRVREQIHIDSALQQQRTEDQKALEQAVSSSLAHSREEARLEQERKLAEQREVMEAEMRTQLRRQAAAHTDHVTDVLKVQDQELRAEAQQVLSSALLEQETVYRQQSQEQLDSFTLEMNNAYARLKGVEEAIDSHVTAEEEARRAHLLWLSVESLSFSLRSTGLDRPSEPLEEAVQAVMEGCRDDGFALALAAALPEEARQRGVYGEEELRSRFASLKALCRRLALVDPLHNSLFHYFLSYLQAALLWEEPQLAPPPQLGPPDLDPFRLLAYASYCLERGDLQLAAQLTNQLTGEAGRAAQDWLKEARLTLETRQVVALLGAYANAVGLGTTTAP